MISIRNNSIIIILSTLINIFEFYNIELTLTVSNLMLICISLSTSIYNYIIFNDLYFEIKNNLNLYLYPNYYPSNRKYYQYILITNSFVFILSSILYCYNYLMIDNNILDSFKINYDNIFKFICVILLLLFVLTICMILLYDVLMELFTLSSYYINHMLFNYTHDLPIFSNMKKLKQDNMCWVCNKKLLKTEYTTLIHCPCNKHYHSKCIEQYLLLYKNRCPEGHRIAKFKNEV